MRAPALPQLRRQATNGSRLTPKELLAAVEKTPIGKEFVGKLSSVPKCRWGATKGGLHGEWTGKSIVLNEAERDILSDNQWKQVIAQELGNAVNDGVF